MRSGEAPWVVILAAGEGSRVLGLTRDRQGAPAPKQFALIDGGNTLLETTVRRATRIAPRERIVIVVARQHRRWWAPDFARLAPCRVLVQPENRGTAAGILLPLVWITSHDPAARLVVLPSDHGVAAEDVLGDAISAAVDCTPGADSGLLLLGVRPERPEADYGWIVPRRPDSTAVNGIASFREKPNRGIAADLFARGGLLNSFIMVAGGRSLSDRFRTVTPALWRSFLPIRRSLASGELTGAELARHYRSVPVLDFSKDLVERSAHTLRVLPTAPCGWCDLGTPERLARYLEAHDVDRRTARPGSTPVDGGSRRFALRPGSFPCDTPRAAFDRDVRPTVRRSAGPLAMKRTEAREVIP